MKGIHRGTEELGREDIIRAAITYTLAILAIIAVSLFIVSRFVV